MVCDRLASTGIGSGSSSAAHGTHINLFTSGYSVGANSRHVLHTNDKNDCPSIICVDNSLAVAIVAVSLLVESHRRTYPSY